MLRFLILISLFFSLGSYAQAFNPDHRVQVTTNIFLDRMNSYQPIPLEVMNWAQCIAVTRVMKLSILFFGGEGSTGLVSCKVGEEWSAPSFYNWGGPSVGIHVGLNFIDSILVFISPTSRYLIDKAQLNLGGDCSVALGPVGREGSAPLMVPNVQVLSYEKNQFGFYAGVSLHGLVMGPAPVRNHQVYGTPDSRYILSVPGRLAPATVRPFVDVLNYYTPHYYPGR